MILHWKHLKSTADKHKNGCFDRVFCVQIAFTLFKTTGRPNGKTFLTNLPWPSPHSCLASSCLLLLLLLAALTDPGHRYWYTHALLGYKTAKATLRLLPDGAHSGSRYVLRMLLYAAGMTCYTWSYLHHFRAGQIFRAAVTLWKPQAASADKQAWGGGGGFFHQAFLDHWIKSSILLLGLVHKCDVAERKEGWRLSTSLSKPGTGGERIVATEASCLVMQRVPVMQIPKHTSYRGNEQNYSEAESFFNVSCEKLKLKTDTISNHRSRQQMKTATLKAWRSIFWQ